MIAPHGPSSVPWDEDEGDKTFVSSPPADMPAPPQALPADETATSEPAKSKNSALNRQVDLKKVLAIAGVLIALTIGVVLALGKGSGTLVVKVNGPDAADVAIDGKFKGKAAPEINLESLSVGYHVLTVSAEGFKPFLEQILMEKGKLVIVDAELQKKKPPTGIIKVVTTPPGATIMIDGEDSGKKTPASIALDSEVPHVLKLVRKYHHEHIATGITLKAKEEKELNVKLKPSAILIKILSTPMGADVLMGNKVLGQTPYILEHDPDGGYPKITVKKRRCRGKITTSIPFDPEVAEMDFPVVLKGCR